MTIGQFEMLAGGMPAPLICVEIEQRAKLGLWLDLPTVYTAFAPDCKDGTGRKGGKTYICALENGAHTPESKLLAENARISLIGICKRAETSFGSNVPNNYVEIINNAPEVLDADPYNPVESVCEMQKNPAFLTWAKDAINNGVPREEIVLRASSLHNYTWDGAI